MKYCLLFSVFVLCVPQAAAQAPAPKGPISFVNDVAPIFKENCFSCHDAKKRKGKLDMTTYEAFRKGGDNEDPIVPGQPDDSRLLSLLTTTTARRMPPKDAGEPLSKAKIAVIEQWIKEGAKADVDVRADLVRELRLRWQPPAPPQAYLFPTIVNALAFTPDGKQVVVGGHHELTVWDIESGKLTKRVNTRAERAYAMLFLPDGKLAVAGGRPGQEGDVRIYDLAGGTPKKIEGVDLLDGVNDKTVMLREIISVDDAVLCLSISEDGKRLAAGGCDRLVRVWDLSPGYEAAKLEQTSENHADWVMAVALAADGKHLLTASRDKLAKVWDLSTKESVFTFAGHQLPVYGVVASPDSKLGYSVGEDGNLRRWNAVAEGKEVGNVAAHAKGALKIVMHPKQPLIATCGVDNTTKTWDLTGKPLQTFSGHTDQVFAVALSPDATLIASGSYNGDVRIWKVADGMLVKAFNASPGYVSVIAPEKK